MSQHVIQSIVQEIQFWKFMGGSNFAQATIILGCSNRAIPGMKAISCPSHFICMWQQRAVKNNFSYPTTVLLWHF